MISTSRRNWSEKTQQVHERSEQGAERILTVVSVLVPVVPKGSSTALPTVFLCESANYPLLLKPVVPNLAAHYNQMLGPLTWGLRFHRSEIGLGHR